MKARLTRTTRQEMEVAKRIRHSPEHVSQESFEKSLKEKGESQPKTKSPTPKLLQLQLRE